MSFADEFESIKASAREWAKRDRHNVEHLVLSLTQNWIELRGILEARWLEQDYDDERNGDWTR